MPDPAIANNTLMSVVMMVVVMVIAKQSFRAALSEMSLLVVAVLTVEGLLWCEYASLSGRYYVHALR